MAVHLPDTWFLVFQGSHPLFMLCALPAQCFMGVRYFGALMSSD